MVKSMTGFGRGDFISEKYKFIVEIKTVNHRYADLNLRMSRRLNFVEDKIRENILNGLSRGKIDVNIQFEDFSVDSKNIELDEVLAEEYQKTLLSIKNKFGLADEIRIMDIATFPEVIKLQKNEPNEDELWLSLKQALDAAIKSLQTMREREGGKLEAIFEERICSMEKELAVIIEKAPLVVVVYKEKLTRRINEILEQKVVDENRLATEVAFYADKCNIDEEIDRLNGHISHFRKIMKSGQPVGRKLDFLVQEMNREVNTIGSKASDIDIINQVVELKSEIEKIREQIQNIE